MKVCALVDPMASMSQTVEEEYQGIKDEFEDEIFPDQNIDFESKIQPHHLANKPVDFYIFDFGGMLPGAQGLIDSQVREFIRQAENHPNALFILYSAFTGREYKNVMEDEFPELKLHNVYIKGSFKELKDVCHSWKINGIIPSGLYTQ